MRLPLIVLGLAVGRLAAGVTREQAGAEMELMVSQWIDMNLFSISPELVVVDRDQTTLIKLLEKHGLDVIPLKLRHSKMLGGGFHCVTLDIRRAGSLERYFD